MACISLVIPTFNRAQSLAILLDDIAALPPVHIEVVVVDNCSTDSTPEVVSRFAGNGSCKYVRNDFNIGIEGNIIKAMLAANGEYVWLLSDHMRLLDGAVTLFNRLQSQSDVVLAYAKIAEYESVLGDGIAKHLSELSDRQKAGLLFCTSNISGLVVRRDFLLSDIRQLYRCSRFTYPHMGVFAALPADALVLEVDHCTRFQDQHERKSTAAQYDTFTARFVEYPLLLKYIASVNRALPFSRAYQQIAAYSSAFRWELLRRFVQFVRPLTSAQYVQCLWLYGLKFGAMLTVLRLATLIPLSVRAALGASLVRLIRAGRS